MAPASKCGGSPVTSTGCTVAAPVVTIVLVPSKLPLDAAIATDRQRSDQAGGEARQGGDQRGRDACAEG